MLRSAEVSQRKNLATLLQDFSVEITGKDLDGLENARGVLPAGTRVHVTHLANEDLSMRLAASVAARRFGFVAVPHISARRLSSREELEKFLAELQAAGAAENVVVVGGDAPQPEGPYEDSIAVLRSGLLQRYGVTHVGVTGYPEGHPNLAEDRLWWAIDEKFKVLSEQRLLGVVITQFGFDADPVLSWIAALRERGIEAPIRIGVPGPTGVRQLLAYAKRFGVGTSTNIARKYGLSLTNLMGTAGPDGFIESLAIGYDPERHGAVKLHFYTFGGLKQTTDWVADFTETLDAQKTTVELP